MTKYFQVESSARQLMSSARTLTGIDIVDASIEDALTRLLQSLNSEAQLSRGGAEAWQRRLLRLLSNRLRMQRDFAAHPEIDEQQIARPVMLSGGPRTGTTKLHKMLAASGDFLYLPFWQVHEPALRGGDRSEDPAARIDDAAQYIEWFNQSAPNAALTHGYGVLEPEEEIIFMEHHISCGFVMTLCYVPSFVQWWQGQDLRQEYRFFKQGLKYLQWQFHDGDPRPWILKCPLYLGFEPWLKEVFPDATLVTTNRAPASTISSILGTIWSYHSAFSDADHRAQIGQMILEGRSAITQLHMSNRERQPELNILDIGYTELTQDGAQAAEKIYAHAGMPLSDQARRAMRQWEAEHAQHKAGTHIHSLEEFSLTAEQVDAKYAGYIDRFRDEF